MLAWLHDLLLLRIVSARWRMPCFLVLGMAAGAGHCRRDGLPRFQHQREDAGADQAVRVGPTAEAAAAVRRKPAFAANGSIARCLLGRAVAVKRVLGDLGPQKRGNLFPHCATTHSATAWETAAPYAAAAWLPARWRKLVVVSTVGDSSAVSSLIASRSSSRAPK